MYSPHHRLIASLVDAGVESDWARALEEKREPMVVGLRESG